jgi:hypothetical protein
VEIFLVCPEHAFVDGKSLWMVFFVHVYVHGAREHYVKTVFVSPEYMMSTKPKMLPNPFETEYHNWLIDYDLTSSDQYFTYIQDENRFNNISIQFNILMEIAQYIQLTLKPFYGRNEGEDGSTTFHCHCRTVWRVGYERTTLSFVAATMRLLFFEIYKRGLRVQGMWHSPNVLPTMVHGRSFHIYNPTPSWEIPYPPPGYGLSSSVDLNPGFFQQYPAEDHEYKSSNLCTWH